MIRISNHNDMSRVNIYYSFRKKRRFVAGFQIEKGGVAVHFQPEDSFRSGIHYHGMEIRCLKTPVESVSSRA